jgi:hypothetical protein
LAEIAVKTIGIVLYRGIEATDHDVGYRLGYSMIRASGMGDWESAIRQATSLPLAAYLSQDLRELLVWASKKRNSIEDGWLLGAQANAGRILKELDVDAGHLRRAATANDLITALVIIRNKTKAHGAVGPDFFDMANPPYIEMVKALLENCPIFYWRWVYLHNRDKQPRRGVYLSGTDPTCMGEKESGSSGFRVGDFGLFSTTYSV